MCVDELKDKSHSKILEAIPILESHTLISGRLRNKHWHNKPRLKSPINRFPFSAGLNLEKLNTNLSGTNHI